MTKTYYTVAKGIKIEKAGDVNGWWDYWVYKEIDGSDTVVGFIKEHSQGGQFVVGQDQAQYNFDTVEETKAFVQSGRW
jgi:hypothetical protein